MTGTGKMDYAALLPHVARLIRAPGLVEIDNPADSLAARQSAEFIRIILMRTS